MSEPFLVDNAAMAHCERRNGGGVLTTDVLQEVLKRVNGATMARASCVSTQFRSVSDEEPFWENLCHQRWPSIAELASVKELVSSMGGFRKLYSNCFPFILCDSKTSASAGQYCYEDSNNAETAASGLVSIVDVSCHGEPLLSRIVTGVPGATAVCGPLVDIAGEGLVGATESITSLSTLWEVVLCSQIRLSWILINKETHQAVNLSNWKPLSSGVDRCDGDDAVVLRFGSMLPSTSTTSSPVHCNVTLTLKRRAGNRDMVALCCLYLQRTKIIILVL